MIRRLFYTYVFLLLTCGSSAAQYRFDQWTADNGLPQNSVTAIAQTADGYLWLTTNDGLVRFDGVRFTVFNKSNSPNLPNNRLKKMLANGNDLWILTEENNLVRFRGGEFKQFTTADGLASNIASFVTKGIDGNILVYQREGVFRFENETFTLEQKFTDADYYLTHPYLASSGAVWNLTREKLIENKSGKTTEYRLPTDLINFLAATNFNTFFNSYTTKILETEKRELWFTVGFYIYKLENGEIVRISKEETSSFDAKIVSDKNGDLWFGIWRKGVCRFANNDYSECLDANEALAGDSVRDIFLDREGTLWIASNANGLFRMTEQFIAPLFTDETSVGKNVYPILEDKSGAVWIGTSNGLSVFKNGKFTDYRQSKRVLVESLCEDRDGRLWVGTVNSGLFLFENGKFYDTQEKLNFSLEKANGSASVFDIHQDKNGVLWFATNTGL